MPAVAQPALLRDDRIPRGTVLGGRYEVGHHLGSGGMGTVYAARDRLLEMPVALKFVRPHLAEDAREQGRLWREIRLAQAITHVNVVRTFTLERHQQHLFIVMELLEGESLAERLRRGALPVDEAVRVTKDVLGALSAAHAKRIIHRDIKPQNTWLSRDGRVVVMDFGIARTAMSEQPASNGPIVSVPAHTVLAGTPGYIAPEVLAGARATAASDLYAVGVLLVEMLVGRSPWDAPTATRADTGDPAPTASEWIAQVGLAVPPPLAAIIARLVAVEPEQRFASAAEALGALDALATTHDIEVPPRRGWQVAGVIAAMAAFGVAAAVALAPRAGAPTPRPSTAIHAASPEPASSPRVSVEPAGAPRPAAETAPAPVPARHRRSRRVRPIRAAPTQPPNDTVAAPETPPRLTVVPEPRVDTGAERRRDLLKWKD